MQSLPVVYVPHGLGLGPWAAVAATAAAQTDIIRVADAILTYIIASKNLRGGYYGS